MHPKQENTPFSDKRELASKRTTRSKLEDDVM